MTGLNKSAWLALAAVGGLWAWRNRDKIQDWVNTQRNQLENKQAYTDRTHRFNSTSRTEEIPFDTVA